MNNYPDMAKPVSETERIASEIINMMPIDANQQKEILETIWRKLKETHASQAEMAEKEFEGKKQNLRVIQNCFSPPPMMEKPPRNL